MRKIQKPTASEYAAYASKYVDLLPDDGLVLQHLKDNLQVVKDLMAAQPEAKLSQPWKAGEWTVKEILVHMMDAERIFAYRALRFARNDQTELPGFEQDDYVPNSGANERTIESILEEYSTMRMATIALFANLDDAALLRSGFANKNPMSVRAAVYQIAGHELHHLHSIQENYLTDAMSAQG